MPPPTPPPIPLSPILTSALLGLARTKVYNDDDLAIQKAALTSLLRRHQNLAPHLQALLSNLTAQPPDPEVGHVRHARLHLLRTTPTQFVPKPPLSDFCAELLALLTSNAVAALHLAFSAHLSHPTQLPARHSLTLLSALPVEENATRLHDLFANLHVYLDEARLPAASPFPTLQVTLLRISMDDPAQFDRMRFRLAIRLASLSAKHLGYRGSAASTLGTVRVQHAHLPQPVKKDPTFVKEVFASDTPHAVAASVARALLLRRAARPAFQALMHAVDTCVSTVRVVILSRGSWTVLPDNVKPTHRSPAVRTFAQAGLVRCVEARLDLMEEWDSPVFLQALMHGVSASVLVFRFPTLDDLAASIGRSKRVTDCFPGLTTEIGRVMYVDTDSRDDFADWRDEVHELAIDRRLLPPHDADILFEHETNPDPSFALGQSTFETICFRATQLRTILHAAHSGPSRESLQRVIAVLNREINFESAKKESAKVINLLHLLRGSIHAKVSVRKPDNVVVVSRGDTTGYSLGGGGQYMRVEEYHDYRDIGQRLPFCADATVRLGQQGSILNELGRFGSRGRVIGRMDAMVRDGELLMAVADERKVVLQKRKENYLTSVYLKVFAGGMTEFLHAKLIRACVEAVRAESDTNDQTAIRTILRLVPGLIPAVYNLQGYEGRWSSSS